MKRSSALRRACALVAACGAGAPAVALEPPSAAELAPMLAPIVELRHAIHAHPELGYEEVETARRVAEHLRALGLEVRTGVARTGVVAMLVGGRPGPVVAVRADMDALPVTEATDLPFRSTRRATWMGAEVGVAHACGHDVHTAAALGVASGAAPRRAEIRGHRRLPLPARRGGAAAGRGQPARSLMLREGVLDDPRPEAIFALHSLAGARQVGQGRRSLAGPIFAAVDQFVATLRGKQSHGAYPAPGSRSGGDGGAGDPGAADHPLAHPAAARSRAW